MVSKIQGTLFSMKDDDYRLFQSKIVTDSHYEIIGVRLPQIRKYAKQLAREKEQILFEDRYFEEVLLHGLYIATLRCPFDEKIAMIEDYLPLIDSWAICDSFVTSIKDITKNRETYFPFLKKYLSVKAEFIQRYALVVLLDHYITDEWLDELYQIVETQNYQGYYSLMAGAWLLSYLFIHDFNRTAEFVRNAKLDDFIRKKGIRKALDSYQLNLEQKNILRSL